MIGLVRGRAERKGRVREITYVATRTSAYRVDDLLPSRYLGREGARAPSGKMDHERSHISLCKIYKFVLPMIDTYWYSYEECYIFYISFYSPQSFKFNTSFFYSFFKNSNHASMIH